MECLQALDHLRSKLEGSFGKAMAMMILAAASNETGVSTVALNDRDFQRLADAVCRDQRVIDMWGAAGAADTATQWRQLVSS
jgi:hypothetical protein